MAGPRRGRVVAREPLAERTVLLAVALDDPAPEVAAGQFAQLRCRADGAFDPLLPRPLSIADVEIAEGRTVWRFLSQAIGPGTRWLDQRRAGDELTLLGPLGRGYDLDPARPRLALVGGGVGLAPFFLLARRLAGAAGDRSVAVFQGARAAARLIAPGRFAALGLEEVIATEDGSVGERGLVTAPLARWLEHQPERSQVLACGPEPMLAAVLDLCARERVPAQVSLERTMACGVGICYGCVVWARTAEGCAPAYLRTCLEGPVLRDEQLSGLAWRI